MIINQIDLGAPSHPWFKPVAGQEIGTVVVEGIETITWPRGAVTRKQNIMFWAKAWQSLGGAAAGSQTAAKYLLKQLEELSYNRDQQPCFIQFTATADSGASLNTSDLHDGWYIIENFEPDYQNFIVSGLVTCRLTVTEVAPAPPRRMAMAYTGGALTSNYSGAAKNVVTWPVGSSILDFGVYGGNRTGAEGVVATQTPTINPSPFVLSATKANWFKGGVHVYDTLNTASNPVPTSSGTFVHANWVEVFDTHHDFVGDCVITNGFQLLIFVAGSGAAATCYVWNTALATANWQQYATFSYYDDASSTTLQAYSLDRVGPDECSIRTVTGDPTTGRVGLVRLRLQRGRYDVRADLTPLSETQTRSNSLLLGTLGTPKVLYNSAKVCDSTLGDTSPSVQTDYGYGAGFIANSADPFILGFLYQNQPGNAQPISNGNANVGLGDNTSLAITATRSYGFFAIPYGVSGSYSTANLQQEMESATLSGGFVSAADAGSSGGNSAKLPSGTAVGAIAIQAGWNPEVGTYDCWARMRVTSAASGTNQLQVGFYDGTAGSYLGSVTYKPSDLTTSYAWYRVATAITTVAAHSQEFRAISVTNAAATDFWLDEMVLVPKILTADARGPQDLYQQFIYDRSVRMVRA